MYKQGLKLEVRAELMRSGARVNNLDELINKTICLDNALYELRLAERSYARQPMQEETGKNPRFPGRQNRRSQPNQGRPRHQYQLRHLGTYYSWGPKPMHLNNLNKGKDDWKNKDYKKGPETWSCYNCSKPGHLSRDCCSKNKVTR
jgi:hypothetical protein